MRRPLKSRNLCNKMRVLQALLSAALISTSFSHSIEKRESSEKRVVCYYTNWSVYRPGTAKYNPQNINPYLCTHLIYAFGGLDRENGLRPYDKYQDIEQGGYAKFTGLKSYNKNLKTMLAIGGWNEGSARFSPLVADEERRAEFVKNVVKFLRVNHFDGLDLDWEYPAFRDGGKQRDRDNYAQLVQELREEFDREHDKTGRPRLLLTMAVPAGIEYIDKGYDVPKLNRYLDFMNILSYDYHSAFEPAVNHHSPLFPLEEESEYNFDAQLSIDYTVKHFLKAGADRDKLVLGIPTYGRSYTLFNPDSTDIGAPSDGPGEQGDATREKGYLAYYEICDALKNEDDWTVVQPKPRAMGPYAFRKNQWVGYDDIDIVKHKAQYVNDQGLGGIMFWSIDNDDFRGKCHDRPYPLIEAAKEALYASSASQNNLVSSSNKREKVSSLVSSRRPKPTKPKPRPTTTTSTASPSKAGGLTTPEPPTTPDPGSDFVCKDEGFFPHPRDCKKYFWCLDSGPSNLGIVAHQFTCPSGLFFNKAADSCDYTRNVLCNKKEKSTTAAPKVTAATSKTTAGRVTTTTTTTTTTTEAPVEEEYEEEEEHEQEDPESIKQLIQLIKKLGGLAELEKQLEGAGGASTPSIPRSLYNKVLTPQRPRYQSPFRNGPSGPQNEGLSQKDDGAAYRREKPQYVTIRRERPSTEAPEEEVEEPEPVRKYTSVQRQRPSAQYEVEEKGEEEITPRAAIRYQTIERTRPPRPVQKEEEEEEEEEDREERFRPKYSSIQRTRPTTVEPPVEVTSPRYVTLRRQRPQVEQQLEESTIKHTGETIVIEQEEEIKPIEIDIEEPIPTSVRPKLKVGGTKVRVGFRRPATPRSRQPLVTTTSTEAPVPERPVVKFYRRRVNKHRSDARNATTLQSAATTSPIPDVYETTAKQRRFEFPRRTVRPSINSLPQQSALVATPVPLVEIEDNHSDESLHEVDTETVERQEFYNSQSIEDSTLPDLANVAVAAIQSLATAPPSTETVAPVIVSTTRRQPLRTTTRPPPSPPPPVRRGPPRPFSKVTTAAPKSQYISKHKPYDDLAPDYEDYYAEPVDIPLSGKVRIHNDGYIECLDIGNFPHPFACKQFISCAKMENGHLLGWEYTCPRGLSFDPIGGICNWSAGLGCKE
ncbi:proteoglycan 4 isoform X2 [Homalodisca vitripennis]|uniref:proteoglycan 4 isoform X2 n=1 Tax=Homalodisca vitripennis TaxID=197043 RepID=UPI001EECE286|nr:proteoglycan 4 isoform X2 [Homalodisca vitripennis]